MEQFDLLWNDIRNLKDQMLKYCDPYREKDEIPHDMEEIYERTKVLMQTISLACYKFQRTGIMSENFIEETKKDIERLNVLFITTILKN